MTDSPEVLFLRSYKDAIMYFNMLDRNLAYCLRWASGHDDTRADLLAFLSQTYDKKLKKITSLIGQKKREFEYSDFLTLAEQCRTLRNKIVHGHWEFVAHLPKPIRFDVPAPFQEKGDLTQGEFSTLVSCFQRTNSLFIELSKKYPIDNA